MVLSITCFPHTLPPLPPFLLPLLPYLARLSQTGAAHSHTDDQGSSAAIDPPPLSLPATPLGCTSTRRPRTGTPRR